MHWTQLYVASVECILSSFDAGCFSAVGGLDLEAMLATAQRKSVGAEAKQVLVDVVDDRTGDRVQVSLE